MKPVAITYNGDCRCVPDQLGALPKSIRLGSKYGWRMHPVYHVPKLHEGSDYGMPIGSDLFSMADGVIEKVVLNNKTAGTYVVIDFRSGGLPYRAKYLHLSEVQIGNMAPINAKNPDESAAKKLAGRKVTRGEKIGLSGGGKGVWGGGTTTGPHLHLQLDEWDGKGWKTVESSDRIDWRGVNLVRSK